jgi:hypothetical protein
MFLPLSLHDGARGFRLPSRSIRDRTGDLATATNSHRLPGTCSPRCTTRRDSRNAVQLPTHASWLNQVEIFFSIVQRKVLTPNDFQDLAVLAHTLNEFEHHWNTVAEPFEWNFARDDLAALLDRLRAHEPRLRLAA